MKLAEVFRFSKKTVILRNKSRIILGNTDTGEWIKVSKECYDIIYTAINQEYLLKEFFDVFVSEDDKKYMKNLIEKMFSLDLITQELIRTETVPQFITFAITNRCNLRCKHCCVSATDEADILSIYECKEIIDKIVKLQPEQVIFTGGEPFIRNDFIELLEYTRGRFNKHIGIMTNGLLLTDKKICKVIKLVNSIDISLDGIDEESCSQIRGKGVFSKVMQIVDKLHEMDFHNISLSMVITRQNQKLVDEFYQLNKEKGTKPMLRSFSPIGRGKVNKNGLEIKRGTLVKNREEKMVTCSSDMKLCSCGALKKNIYIDYRGEIYPCPVLLGREYCFGKVLDKKDMEQYFRKGIIKNEENYSTFLNLYPQNYSECKECNVNLFCWSCLHHIDLLKNGVISRTPNCEERKKQLQEIVWGDDE